MYTCCPECETTFRLGVDDLRRAQGRVRCGECAHVFNALEYLTEDIDTNATPQTGRASGKEPVFGLPTMAANDDLDDAYEEDEEDTGLGILVTDTGNYDITEAEAWSEVQADMPDEDETDAYTAEDDEDKAHSGPNIRVTETGDYMVTEGDSWNKATTDSWEADEVDPKKDSLTAIIAAEEGQQETGMGTDSPVKNSANYDITEAEAWNETISDGLDDFPEDRRDQNTAAHDPYIDSEVEAETDPDEHEFDDTVWERIPGVGASAYADNGLQSARNEAPEPGEAGSDKTEHETSLGDLEFNVPEEKWSNFFDAAPKVSPVPDLEAIATSVRQNEGSADSAGDEPDDNIQLPDASDAHSEDWQEIVTGSWSVGSMQDVDEQTSDTALAADNAAETEAVFSYADAADDDPENYATTPPWQETEYQAEPPPEKASRSGLWFLAGLLLFTGFTAQIIHYKRDMLAAHPAYGSTVRSAYAWLGTETYPDWPIANYEIRGSEAVAGESGKDILDIRAQIASIGDTATGLPLLRVILRDRWSNPVAARHFSPEEYIVDSDLPEDGLLLPNETISARVSIVDPGSGAQGFELQLCLPRRGTGLDCTGQPFK